MPENDPACGSSHSEDNVNQGDVMLLWCEVTYRGRWAPRMTWRDQHGQVLGSTNVGQNGSSVRQELTYTVPASEDPIALSCVTDFAPVVDNNEYDETNRSLEAVNSLTYTDTYTKEFTVNNSKCIASSEHRHCSVYQGFQPHVNDDKFCPISMFIRHAHHV